MALFIAGEGTPMGRTAEFNTGANAHRAEYDKKSFKPDSILHPVMKSPNGLSEEAAGRRLQGGGMLPSSNSYSQDTYSRKQPLLSPYRSF